jgi:hypothetical protein
MGNQLKAKAVKKTDTAPLTHRLAHKQPAQPAQPPTPAAQKRIISDQIVLWSNTLYQAQVQARVAKAVGNEKLQHEAQGNADQAIRALDELAAILAELGC